MRDRLQRSGSDTKGCCFSQGLEAPPVGRDPEQKELQEQKSPDDFHSGAAGEAGGGVREAAVHGGAGTAVFGTYVAADGGSGGLVVGF